MNNILDYLSEGEENAVTCKRLAELCNCNIRQITAQISQLRQKGYVILSSTQKDSKGYFLPANKEEVERFVLSMRSRIKRIKLASISAEQMLTTDENQMQLEV